MAHGAFWLHRYVVSYIQISEFYFDDNYSFTVLNRSKKKWTSNLKKHIRKEICKSANHYRSDKFITPNDYWLLSLFSWLIDWTADAEWVFHSSCNFRRLVRLTRHKSQPLRLIFENLLKLIVRGKIAAKNLMLYKTCSWLNVFHN